VIAPIAVPYSRGRRDQGMGGGPAAMIEKTELEAGVAVVEVPDTVVPEIARTFELNRRLAREVERAAARAELPLVFSGNCNCCWGATAGVSGSAPPAVLWLDAHADFDLPEDNLSGFLDVMALSTPANEYAAPGGFTLEEVLSIVAATAGRFDLASASITAYNPEVDSGQVMAAAAERIARALAASG
jgi:arginase family enzyme